MSKLKFNSAGVIGAKKKATSAQNTSASVKDGIASIQKNMQSCVMGRSNISSRLTNVKSSLTQIEKDIVAIYQTADSASTKYINTETNVVRLGQAVVQSAKITTTNGNNRGAFAPVTVDKRKTGATINSHKVANSYFNVPGSGTTSYKKIDLSKGIFSSQGLLDPILKPSKYEGELFNIDPKLHPSTGNVQAVTVDKRQPEAGVNSHKAFSSYFDTYGNGTTSNSKIDLSKTILGSQGLLDPILKPSKYEGKLFNLDPKSYPTTGNAQSVPVDKSNDTSKDIKKEDVKWNNILVSNGADLLKKCIGKVGFIGSVTEVVVDFSKGVSDDSKYKMGKAIAKGGKSFVTFFGDLASNAYKPAKQQDWKKPFIGDWSPHSLLKNLNKTATPVQKIRTGGVKFLEALKKETVSYSMKNAQTVGDKIKVGTKWGGVALSAISNGIGNIEEHGELNGRAIGETIGETIADVVVGAGATAAVVGAAAAIGVSAPAVIVGVASVGVVWIADKIVKATTGKRSTSELISDSVLDLGEAVVGGAKKVINAVGDVIGNIGVKWKSCFG